MCSLFLFILLWLENFELFIHGFIVHLKQRDRHVFNVVSIDAIFTVNELKNLISGGSHSLIILDLYIFQCFDQPSLDVSSFGCLACCINQTFPTAHSMEVKFLRSQPEEITICYEYLAIRAIIILTVVRQRSPIETKRDSLSFNVLLTATGHDLRNV